MNRYIAALLMAALAFANTTAKVRLPHVLGDDMVLQQDTEVRLWGWDTPGTEVKITVSWSAATYTATTGGDGKWAARVKTPKASYTPLSITFDDGEATTIGNLLAGEVWLCTGQSNMEIPMMGFSNCPIEGQNAETVGVNRLRGIRCCTIASNYSMKPKDDCKCRWQEVSAKTLGQTSAVGYFFAKTLNTALDLPVGIIVAAKGGTRVEAWLDYDNLKRHTDEPLDEKTILERYSSSWQRPMVWGNATVHPILNYTLKGILYYQGCSNKDRNISLYAERVKLLAEQWRRECGLGELPFYIVQIAPYAYHGNRGGTETSLLQEQQWKAAKSIAGSGLVCTTDLVYPWEGQQIHPTQKRQIGERLAYQALNKQYGWKNLCCESPEYERMDISNDTCRVTLRNVYKGICYRDSLEGFEMAGEDRVFHPAKAVAKGRETLIITCEAVKRPVAVRYAFHNVPKGNVFNQAMLPLIPFRTDDWQP